MLEIINLDYRIGPRVLFDGVSARIAAGWKVGLVGRNGTGKSTLLKLIREDVATPRRDAPIRLQQGARIGHVAQEIAPGDETIINAVLAADVERASLLREADTATDPARIADIHARLTDIDAWSAEARAAEVLMGLGFRQDDLCRPTREFSGGWRMRAAIGGALFSQPDLLLLDEPTNYLDLEGAAWLESYLRKYPHTFIIVSHDRDLLNRCVTHTLALEQRKLHLSPGGYDAWLSLRAAKLAQLESQRARQEADRAHLQAFIDRFRAKASKARQAQSRIKMLERMQAITVPLAERTVPFSFPAPTEKLSPPLLEIRKAELGYGPGASILRGVDIRLDPDDRIAIIGTNGQGKTTLVKSIAGRLPLMAGERAVPKAVRIGYFSQDQLDELTEGETLLDHVRRALPNEATPAKVRAVAASLGFPADKVDTVVEALSGGEKVRLILGLIGLKAPHILILDEPTSHLDIDSREALIYALNDFPGAVLLITHDVYLAEATADRLWLVKDGRVSPYEGDLADYRALVLSAERVPEIPSARAAGGSSVSARKLLAQQRESIAPLKRRASELERTCERLQAELARIDAALSTPDTPPEQLAALGKARASKLTELEAAEAAWLEAMEAYEQAASRVA